MLRALATRGTWYSAAAGLTSGSRPDADAVTNSIGTGALPLAARSASTRDVMASINALDVEARFEPPDEVGS